MLVALGLSGVLIGCAMNPSAETKNQMTPKIKSKLKLKLMKEYKQALNMLRR